MSVETATVTWNEVDLQLRRIAGERAKLEAEEARWLRMAVGVSIHRQYGYATIFEYMERVLGYSPRVARDRLRVAEALAELPAIDEALARGQICYSAARELVQVARPHTEEAWLLTTQDCTIREIEATRAGLAPGALPGDERDPALMRHRLSFDVPAATFALFRDARRHLEDEMGQSLDEGEMMAAMCRIVLGGPKDEGRASHQIALTICEGCGRAWQDGGGQAVEVPDTVVDRAACDAQRIGRLDAPAPAPAKQDTPPATKRLVFRRDHGRCVVPGCRSSRYLDVHHIHFRAHGGPHDPMNLALLCGGHHDALHEGRLRMTGSPGDWTFTRADGQPYCSSAVLGDAAAGIDESVAPRAGETPDSAGGVERARVPHVGEPAAAPPGQGQVPAGRAGQAEAPAGRGDPGEARDAYLAMRKLGFREAQARAAVAYAAAQVGAGAGFETLVREALKATQAQHGRFSGERTRGG